MIKQFIKYKYIIAVTFVILIGTISIFQFQTETQKELKKTTIPIYKQNREVINPDNDVQMP